MSTLITGATGFIGMRLAQRLAGENEIVHALCRASSETSGLRHRNIRIYTGDVTDAASIARAVEGCDEIYHLAAHAKNWARDARTYHEINVGGLVNVLGGARSAGVRKIVFTSTSLTLPPSNGSPSHEGSAPMRRPLTEYARSKMAAEEIARRAAEEGVNIVIVNPTRVFGPGLLNESNSATLMIMQYLDGSWRFMPRDGRGMGNWVHVDDVVQGHVLAMRHGRSGERYILGGENASYRDFFNTIAELSGRSRLMFNVPRPLALTVARIEQLRAEWSRHYPLITPEWTKIFLLNWACSTRKAEQELGYTVTPLRAALADTIKWILSETASVGVHA